MNTKESMKWVGNIVVSAALFTAFMAQAADIAVIVHPSSGIAKDQVSDVFLGKNTSGTPIDLPESSPIRAAFYSKVTGKDAAQVKAAWTRLVFSGKAQPPKEFPDAAAVKRAVATDPKAIGYVERNQVDGTVKVLTTLD
jgi:ABC-type phosphate transport system substrate-binding protein